MKTDYKVPMLTVLLVALEANLQETSPGHNEGTGDEEW